MRTYNRKFPKLSLEAAARDIYGKKQLYVRRGEVDTSKPCVSLRLPVSCDAPQIKREGRACVVAAVGARGNSIGGPPHPAMRTLVNDNVSSPVYPLVYIYTGRAIPNSL
jgi:hypothetical protein